MDSIEKCRSMIMEETIQLLKNRACLHDYPFICRNQNEGDWLIGERYCSNCGLLLFTTKSNIALNVENVIAYYNSLYRMLYSDDGRIELLTKCLDMLNMSCPKKWDNEKGGTL